MKELEQQHKGSRLTGFKAFNRGGIEAQLESLVELLDVKWPFQWILPGKMLTTSSMTTTELTCLLSLFSFFVLID
jgi:hypothetical protein